jgi:hypothetical protein
LHQKPWPPARDAVHDGLYPDAVLSYAALMQAAMAPSP